MLTDEVASCGGCEWSAEWGALAAGVAWKARNGASKEEEGGDGKMIAGCRHEWKDGLRGFSRPEICLSPGGDVRCQEQRRADVSSFGRNSKPWKVEVRCSRHSPVRANPLPSATDLVPLLPYLWPLTSVTASISSGRYLLYKRPWPCSSVLACSAFPQHSSLLLPRELARTFLFGSLHKHQVPSYLTILRYYTSAPAHPRVTSHCPL
nr:hypothetical protein CFP56_21813 [Quercus suber]